MMERNRRLILLFGGLLCVTGGLWLTSSAGNPIAILMALSGWLMWMVGSYYSWRSRRGEAIENTVADKPLALRLLPGLITFLIFCSLLSTMEVQSIRREAQLIPESVAWPTTEGVVTESRIVVYGGEYGPDEELEFQYRYEVDGRSYTSSNIRIGNDPGRKYILSMYPADKRVTVYYRPSNPQISTLELTGPPTDADLVKSAVSALLVVTLTVVLVIVYLLKRRSTLGES